MAAEMEMTAAAAPDCSLFEHAGGPRATFGNYHCWLNCTRTQLTTRSKKRMAKWREAHNGPDPTQKLCTLWISVQRAKVKSLHCPKS